MDQAPVKVSAYRSRPRPQRQQHRQPAHGQQHRGGASTRLANIYLEQSLFEDAVNIRIGQFLADEKFLTSDVAGVFVNSTFGWPGSTPSTCPAAVRPIRSPRQESACGIQQTTRWPAGCGVQRQRLGQHGDKGGMEFPLEGVFAIVEAICTRPGKGEPGLGGNFKFGGWYNSLHFEDLHFDITGLSLADPLVPAYPLA